ncbi:MAG: site-specific DNA-methyltransferase [Formosimonas sp.]
MPLLDWVNKNQAVDSAKQVPYHLLQHQQTYGDAVAAQGNLIIQGDNLQALKALLPFYMGKVKCIFIDPPYNTQSAFEHYDDKLEHAQWLSMMYPRLVLLRELLAEDGSIWVTLDDREAHYFKVLMDEVFGRSNFVANVVWQKKHTRSNDARWLSDNHDHVLVFAKQKENWKRNLLKRGSEETGYSNIDNDPRGVWASGPCHVKTPNEKDIYPVTTPSGRVLMPPAGTSWRFSKEKFDELIADNRIFFGKNGGNVPRYKRFRTDVQDGLVPITVWLKEEVGHNQDAKTEVKAFNSLDVFSTPKPERLLERVLQIATNENDLILDSFLGSGTTAAVAHKMNRRYIGIEMGAHAVTHCVPRLQKVIEGEQGGISKAVNWQGGGGFGFYTLGAPVFDAAGHITPQVRFNDLAAYIWWLETKSATGAQPVANTPFIGEWDGVAYYVLYNGVLGDRRPNGGNVLTLSVLAHVLTVHPHAGRKVIFGEASRLGAARLTAAGVEFKQIPYELHERV